MGILIFSVDWLDHSKSLRAQGVEETEVLLLRRKYFFSDQNIDARDPIQLNLLYVQVRAWCKTSECNAVQTAERCLENKNI